MKTDIFIVVLACSCECVECMEHRTHMAAMQTVIILHFSYSFLLRSSCSRQLPVALSDSVVILELTSCFL